MSDELGFYGFFRDYRVLCLAGDGAAGALNDALFDLMVEASGLSIPLVELITDDGYYSETKTQQLINSLFDGEKFASDEQREFYKAFVYCSIRAFTTEFIPPDTFLNLAWTYEEYQDEAPKTLQDILQSALDIAWANKATGIGEPFDTLTNLFEALGEKSRFSSIRRSIYGYEPEPVTGAEREFYEKLEQDGELEEYNEWVIEQDQLLLEQLAREQEALSPQDRNEEQENFEFEREFEEWHKEQRKIQEKNLKFTMPSAQNYIQNYVTFEELLPQNNNVTDFGNKVASIIFNFSRQRLGSTPERKEAAKKVIAGLNELTNQLRNSR